MLMFKRREQDPFDPKRELRAIRSRIVDNVHARFFPWLARSGAVQRLPAAARFRGYYLRNSDFGGLI